MGVMAIFLVSKGNKKQNQNMMVLSGIITGRDFCFITFDLIRALDESSEFIQSRVVEHAELALLLSMIAQKDGEEGGQALIERLPSAGDPGRYRRAQPHPAGDSNG